MAERSVEAELRQALAAAAKLKIAAAEAEAAAGSVADKVRRGEVAPGDIEKQVKKEVARANVQRRVGGLGEGRLAGDVAGETREVERLTQAERDERRESSRSAREKASLARGRATDSAAEVRKAEGQLRAAETRLRKLDEGADPSKRARFEQTVGRKQVALSEARAAQEASHAEAQRSTDVERRLRAEERIAQVERKRTALQPRGSAGGGGLQVVREIDRIQRTQEAREARAGQTQAGSFRERLQTVRAIGEAEKKAGVEAARHAERQKGTLASDLSAVRGGGIAGGLGGPPRRPPAPPAPPTGGGGDDYFRGDPDERRAALERGMAAERSMALEERRLRSEFQRTSVVLGSQSDILRRHGALTTEFIAAAARGETTFRELGYQAGATIGKFAGWIGAGAAVFVVVDAMRQMYEGAIEADRGLANLDRVIGDLDRDSARVSLGSLAGEFNLPIRDVTDAAFQMGKVFHDQEGAFKATRAVLASVKVGELEVADASRYLIAIINGFKLPASDMAIVFDQINQAQNKFGVSIRDTEAGIAKAAGTYKAAGGDLSTLLALIATAQKVTGNTGEVIGTAIARSPNFLRKPQNVEILRQFGIDATAPIPEVFQKAFEKARVLSGQELQKLAAAIGGPQYGARVFTPLLQNAGLFRRVMRETSAEVSQGSGMRELEQTLDAVSERIAAVGIGLQELGANLSAAGFGSLIVLGVDAMNTFLDITNAVLSVFNKLPEPVREMVTLLAQAALVMRALQRFRLGDVLASRGVPAGIAGRFNEPEPRYLSRLARRGARDERTYLREDLGKATSAQRLAQREALIVTGRERASQAVITKRLQQANLDASTQANLITQQQVSQQRVLAAKEAVIAAETRQVVLTEELALVEERNAILNNRRKETRQTEVGLATGEVFIPGTLERQTTVAPLGGPRLGPESQDRINALPPGMRQGARTAALQAAAIEAETAAVQAFAPGMRRTVIVTQAQTAALKADAARRLSLAQEFRRARAQFPVLGTAGAAVIGSARRLGGEGGRARVALSGAGSAIRGAATGLRSIAAGIGAVLGPLDLLLIAAAFGIPFLIEQVKKAQEKARELKRAPEGAGDAKRLSRELREFADSSPGIGESFEDAIDVVKNPLSLFGPDPADERRERARERGRRFRALNRGRRLQVERGGRIPYAFPEQIDESVQNTVKEFEAGEITLTEALRRLKNAIDSIEQSHQSEAAKRQQGSIIRARAIEIDPSNRNLFKRYSEIGTDILKQRAEEFEGLIQAGGAGGGDIARYSTIINVLASRFVRKPGLKSRRALAEIGKQQIEGLQAQAQEELGVQLATANTDQERARAYNRYEQVLRRGVGRGRRQSLHGLREAIQVQKQLAQVQVDEIKATIEAVALSGGGGAPTGIVSGALRAARQAIRQRRRQMRDVRRFFRRQMEQIDDLMEEMRAGLGEGEEDAGALYDAQTQVGQYQYTRGLPRINYQISRVGGAIQTAIREHGRNSVEVLQLMAEQESLQEQAADEAFGVLQAQGQVREAGLEGRQLIRVQLSNIAQQIGYLRGNGGSQSEILQLVAQQRQLQHELLLSAREEIESLYELRIARTEDPVRQARLEYQRDRAVRRRLSGTVSPQEARRLRAQEIRSKRTLRDRIVEEELGDIQHREAIGRLTNDQEIQALTRLLRTHKMSRDLRRRIKEQIFQLRQESESDLNLDVGNIRLPTAYDIRRIAQQGTAQAPGAVVYQNNSFTFNTRNTGDAETIGSALDSIYGTQTRAHMRSAGLT